MNVKQSNLLFGFIMILIVAFAVITTGCTDNQRAKSWGGKMTITLEPQQKLVNVTWKNEDMWILTRQMKPDERPETYKFVEKSTFGIMQGEVTIQETGGKSISYRTTPEMDIQPNAPPNNQRTYILH